MYMSNGQGQGSSSGGQQQATYPSFAYDPTGYGLQQAGPSSSSSMPSYEYSYSRSDLQGQAGDEAVDNNAFADQGWQQQQDQWSQPYDTGYGTTAAYSDWNRPTDGGGTSKSQQNTSWPAVNEYVEPTGPERELSGLRMTLSDLIESIRPYASSSSNPRPPPPPAHLQARFLRLASTVQTSLSNLQPHIHPFLHPSFNLPPPATRRRHESGSRSRTPLTSAEKEMEVIRKRRDMLIARAAQVQASSHPAAVHNSQLPTGWNNHHEVYNGGAAQQQQQQEQNMFDMGLPPGLNSSSSGSGSRRPTMALTLDNFDASLARFSLDPSRAAAAAADLPSNNGNGNGNIPKKSTGEAERCHGCGVSVTAEWRRGPDGPRSLCNACGLHYAKLARRRAQEEAVNANGNSNGNGNGFGIGNPTEPMAFTADYLTGS